MPSLGRITPVILSLNEGPNIGRTLSCLKWASRVVVVDSGSKDGTVEIVRSFNNTELFDREFDAHHSQWNFAVRQVETEWALTLDADYLVPQEVVAEIEGIRDTTPNNGFFAKFDYMVLGRPLRRSLYPPRQVLFRTSHGAFEDDGHTQVVRVAGPTGHLQHRIIHDDRKPLDRWLRNQAGYVYREADKLSSASWSELSWPDRIRQTRILAPPLVLLYTLFVKGLILEGWAGWYYALERAAAETILSLALLRRGYREGEPTRG